MNGSGRFDWHAVRDWWFGFEVALVQLLSYVRKFNGLPYLNLIFNLWEINYYFNKKSHYTCK